DVAITEPLDFGFLLFSRFTASAGFALRYNSRGFPIVSYKYYSAFLCIFLLGFCTQSPAQNSSQSTLALLQGSVTNKITGAPVNHAHVMYIKVASGSSEAQSPISTDTDAQGNYAIQVE